MERNLITDNQYQLRKKYEKLWQLQVCELVASTATSQVYQVETDSRVAILKIYTDLGIADERGGAPFLKHMQGVGAAELYKQDDRAQLIEFLSGPNLYEFSRVGKESLATEVFVDIFNKIRAKGLPNEKGRFDSLGNLFKIFQRVKPPEDLAAEFGLANDLSKHLFKTQTEEIFLHGDLHHENVLQRASGEFVCIDAKGLIGDPAYEFATTLKNPWDFPNISHDLVQFEERAGVFSQRCSLQFERIVQFAFVHFVLSICWAIEDGGTYDHQQTLVKKIYVYLKDRY